MVSVIVPIYNVERYLNCCLDSILTQTYTDFELLLVDDGSNDKSGEICDAYANQDQRIRVFHKNNEGVSSARNLGVQQAKGEWITFVDSDDWLEHRYLESFLQDSDLCVQGFYSGDVRISYDKAFVEKNVGVFYLKHSYVSGPYCKLFKRDIIQKNHLSFDLELAYGEDILFLMQYALYCHNMRVVEYVGYHYRKSVENSLSVRKRSCAEMILQYSKHLLAFEVLMTGTKSEKKEVRRFLKGALCELLDHYDKTCMQILNDSPALKDAFVYCFLPWDKFIYSYFPKLAVWLIGVERRVRRYCNKICIFMNRLKIIL